MHSTCRGRAGERHTHAHAHTHTHTHTRTWPCLAICRRATVCYSAVVCVCMCVRVCDQVTVAASASPSAYSHDPRKSMAEPPTLMAGASIALLALVQVRRCTRSSALCHLCLTCASAVSLCVLKCQLLCQQTYACKVVCSDAHKGSHKALARIVALRCPVRQTHCVCVTCVRACVQARNNARVLVSGSLDMFTNAFFDTSVTVEPKGTK